ncbi:Endopolyphosphatase [Byssothecium circinans]|uniref:Endopolyphosphatase n=1 Tax=Byssothecium circinans TaxID=147558 RepID=A0A6A5TZU5_9PLEO|nr:Endopolyphosphatase [Byssothecium circinans]
MDWIKDNIADQIDFVIWTGDSARHDNDEKIPRTQRQIIKQNEFMVHKFTEVFGEKDGENLFKIPIIPTFGNNDVMPHNILLAGPNKWTSRYLDVWRGMVPEAQRHQFQQGGWFWVEVVQDKLAVISLNTMYFFTSNTGVDGCANKKEPGYEQFEWLRIQLQVMRDRGVSAILIGHVPPARVNSKESWEESCWQKFALWEQQYRDVIVSSFFGHMNIDHFMLQDFKQIKKSAKKGKLSSNRVVQKEEDIKLLEDGEVTVASATDYLLDLRKTWAKLSSLSRKNHAKTILDYDIDTNEEDEEWSIWQSVQMFSKPKKGGKKHGKKPKKSYLDKIGGKYGERYSVSFVSPSVVPVFFPTLRIVEYNITGLEDKTVSPIVSLPKTGRPPSNQIPLAGVDLLDDEAYLREMDIIVKRKQRKKEKEARKKKKKYKFKVPDGPSKSTPPGPAYSLQPLTLLGYTQYFANLTYINNDFIEDNVSPHPTAPRTIFGLNMDEDGEIEASGWKEGKHKKHQGKKPRPKPHPKKFEFEIEYDTKNDKRYKLKDLTVRRWVDLARRIGQQGKMKDAKIAENVEEELLEDEEDVVDDDEYEDHDNEDYGTASEEEDDDGDEMKGGKKEKKHKKKHGRNSAWYTFVRRAFVGTMDPREIKEVFGAQEEDDLKATAQVEEVMEL